MTDENEQSPAPPADQPQLSPESGPVSPLLKLPRESLLYLQFGLALALLTLAVWLSVQYKTGRLWDVIYIVGIVLILLINALVGPALQRPGMASLDVTRLRVLLVVGLFGLLTALYGVLLAYDHWGKVMAWLEESGPSTTEARVLPLLILCLVLAALGMMFASLQVARTQERSNAFLRRLLYGYNAFLAGVLLLGILAVVNALVAVKFRAPLDFTAGGHYTISDPAIKLLRNLPQPVEIYYISRPSGLESEVRAFLSACKDYSDKLQVTEIAVDLEPQRANDLNTKYPGLQVGGLLVVYKSGADKDEYRVIESKDLFASGDRFDPSGAAYKFTAEDALMTTLNELSEGKDKPVIYFTQGHGELGLNDEERQVGKGAAVLKRRLERRRLEVKPLTFEVLGTPKVPDDASLVILAGPRQPAFTPPEVKALQEFMNRKGKRPDGKEMAPGKLIILLPPVIVAGKMLDTGLEQFLGEYGIQAPKERIVTYPTGQRLQPSEVRAVMNPELRQNRLALEFDDVGFRLEDVRPLEVAQGKGMSRYSADPLLLTLPGSAGETDFARTPSEMVEMVMKNEDSRRAKAKQIQAKPLLTVAVAMSEGGTPPMDPHAMFRPPPPSERKPALLVFGTASIATNRNVVEEAERPDFALLSAGIAWLRDKPPGLGIPPKKRDVYAIEPKTDWDKRRMELLPAALVICCVLGLATGVWVVRRR